jgi:hypothetical protein
MVNLKAMTAHQLDGEWPEWRTPLERSQRAIKMVCRHA